MSDFLNPCVPSSPIFSSSSRLVTPVQTLDECSASTLISSVAYHSQAFSSPNRVKRVSPPEKSLIQIQDPGGSVSSPFLKSVLGLSSGVMEQKEYNDSEGDGILKTECPKSTDTLWSVPKYEPTGVGAGLLNLGNTCFMNSVLQCVTHSVPLIDSLRSYKSQAPCNCESMVFCVMQALRGHIDRALLCSGYTMQPIRFRDNLNYFSSEFLQNQQEDAHEFLQSFLDKLERCCVDPRDTYISSEDVNIVDHVFGGRLLSRLRCCNCNSSSDTLESSLGWSLEIEDVDDLWSALESFTRVEKLEDQFTCDNCNNKVSKEKRLMLNELPLIASFHLKRFKNDGFIMEKIFKHVKFPLELDLSPYMSSSHYPNGSTKYHLYAFVEHHGETVTSGHYTSYVRSAPEVWHHFDDSTVTRISEDSVLSQDPYILFYAREGTRWFSRAYEEIKPVLEASFIKHSPNSVLESVDRHCSSGYSFDSLANPANACDPVGVALPSPFLFHEPEEEEVFHSAESSSDDSSKGDAFELPLADKPLAEMLQQKQPNMSNRANVPKIRKQNCCRKRKEGNFKIQREHLQPKKSQEVTCVNPSKSIQSVDQKNARIALSYLKKLPTARAKLFAAAMTASTSAPIKKRKLSNFKVPTPNHHRHVPYRL